VLRLFFEATCIRVREHAWILLSYACRCACVYIYMCVCVTGVQRGPVRGTEFKFQIWSVSQGVTVCIALPAGSNSLHRWCVFVPSLPLSFPTVPMRLPPLPESTRYISNSSSYSFHLSISIFHIIQTRKESDLIDRRKKSPFERMFK